MSGSRLEEHVAAGIWIHDDLLDMDTMSFYYYDLHSTLSCSILIFNSIISSDQKRLSRIQDNWLTAKFYGRCIQTILACCIQHTFQVSFKNAILCCHTCQVNKSRLYSNILGVQHLKRALTSFWLLKILRLKPII